MANYQESNIAGTKYRRAFQVHVQNDMQHKAITFEEEEVINLDGADVIQKKVGSVSKALTADNANTSFALINTETGEPSGQTMTYQEVYAALYGLYLHLAVERDNNPAQDDPVEVPVG